MKRLLKYVLALIIIIAVSDFPLETRYGVDGKLYVRKIPLYAKLSGFLYRDWEYRDIVKEIVGKEKDEAKRALAILRWVNSHIRLGVPKGLKLVDDHPLNIIIRQYGGGDQMEDVFTILCAYAGMEAGMARCYEPGNDNYIILSFVKASGRWLVFDAKYNRYFINKDKNIASIDDILNKKVIFTEKEINAYSRFFAGLKDVNTSSFTRAEEQMLLKRFPAKLKRWVAGK